MLRIAICDCHIVELESVYHYVEQYTEDNKLQDIGVRRFQSPYDLWECIDAGIRFSIYILDTQTPMSWNTDVKTLEKAIIEKDPEGTTLFLVDNNAKKTSESSFPSCFASIQKPVCYEDLSKLLGSFFSQIDRENADSIPIRTKDGYVALKLQHLTCVEYYDHRLIYYLTDGSQIKSVSTREPFYLSTKSIIRDQRFVRPHVAFIVNMSHVHSITSRDFIMFNGEAVPISAKRFTKVKKTFLDYLIKQREKSPTVKSK